jgi:hypothetical protein
MKLNKEKIYIIDNIIPLDVQNNILNQITTTPQNLTWQNYNYPGCELSINNPSFNKLLPEAQFVQDFPSERNIFLQRLEKNFSIKIQDILRIKLNWVPRTHINNKNSYYAPHTDNPNNHWVLIYYVNTSDGDTLLFNETTKEIPYTQVSNQTLNIRTKIEHKKGRAVLFNGKHYHGGCPPIENDYRILINHNFTIEE